MLQTLERCSGGRIMLSCQIGKYIVIIIMCTINGLALQISKVSRFYISHHVNQIDNVPCESCSRCKCVHYFCSLPFNFAGCSLRLHRCCLYLSCCCCCFFVFFVIQTELLTQLLRAENELRVRDSQFANHFYETTNQFS